MRSLLTLTLIAFSLAADPAQIGGGLMFPGPGGVVASTAVLPPAGMSFWYSADCITYVSSVCGVPANGTAITTWADRSGSANTATKATGTCTYNTSQINSQPAVTFASCGLTLASAVGPGGGQWTIFVVAKNTAASTRGDFTSCVGSAQSCFKYYDGGTKQQGMDSSDTAAGPTGSAAQNTNWHQMNVAFQNSASGNTCVYRLDRVADGGGAPGFNVTNPVGSLGYDARSSNEFFAGPIAEVIFYNSLLTGTQITQVETYLNGKYGL